MLPPTEQKKSGASGAKDGRATGESTQNTQYDKIGTKYLEIKTLSALEPEMLSILDALGDAIKGTNCLGMPYPFSHQQVDFVVLS